MPAVLLHRERGDNGIATAGRAPTLTCCAL
jgi:hypothetical protein